MSKGACAFIFDFDVDEQDISMVGIIRDIRLLDSNKKPIPNSSLIMEELQMAGWDSFVERKWIPGIRYEYTLQVSGLYRWEGDYYASQDYYGEWDCGWEVISLEPADRKTRRAVKEFGPGWNGE